MKANRFEFTVHSAAIGPWLKVTCNWKIALLVVGVLGVLVTRTAAASDVGPRGSEDAFQLIEMLRSDDSSDVDYACRSLIERVDTPGSLMTTCLYDMSGPTARYGCAYVLASWPASKGEDILKEAIEHYPVELSADRKFRRFMIGALGRLQSSASVPYLERLLELEPDFETRGAIRWALEKITGKEHGESYDPWMEGR